MRAAKLKRCDPTGGSKHPKPCQGCFGTASEFSCNGVGNKAAPYNAGCEMRPSLLCTRLRSRARGAIEITRLGTVAELRRWYAMARQQRQRVGQRPSGSDEAQAAGPRGGEGEDHARQVMPWARSVHGAAATVTRLTKRASDFDVSRLRVPDMFDVITFFRARGDSYALIASIGFASKENPDKALTVRGLKAWYEAELKKRARGKAAGPR